MWRAFKISALCKKLPRLRKVASTNKLRHGSVKLGTKCASQIGERAVGNDVNLIYAKSAEKKAIPNGIYGRINKKKLTLI